MTGLTATAVWDRKKKTFSPDPIFWEDCDAIADRAEVTIVITTDRNPEQLRLFHWLLSLICKSGAWDGDKDSLDDFTRIGTGFGKWRAASDGRGIFIPNSVALSKCGGLEFERFLYFAHRLWAERLGVDTEALRKEADEAVARTRKSLDVGDA